MPQNPNGVGLTFEVSLQHVKPSVLREVEVPITATFLDFHQALQAAMGWTDSHLFEFSRNGVTVVSPHDDVLPSPTVWMADQHTLTEWKLQPGDAFVYVYDFGDNWVHELRVTGTALNLSRPRLIGGTGACPPEDVGGPPGYQHFLESIADPKHPEHKDYKTWSRGRFIAQFDREAQDQRLAKLFS